MCMYVYYYCFFCADRNVSLCLCPGGDAAGLARTGQYVSDLFQSGALTCLICIASVKRTQAVRDTETLTLILNNAEICGTAGSWGVDMWGSLFLYFLFCLIPHVNHFNKVVFSILIDEISFTVSWSQSHRGLGNTLRFLEAGIIIYFVYLPKIDYRYK